MTAAPPRRDVAAIHVLKSQLRLSEDDYRALLRNLTGKASCSDMEAAQLQAVRQHMDALVRATRGGAAPRQGQRLSAEAFARRKAQARPRERKVFALWHQLGRDGLVANASEPALNAWVQRQVRVSALRFCTDAQLDTLIESLKRWEHRP